MFTLQLVNNWNDMFSGVEAVTNGGARLFYIFQWIVIVLVQTNILVSWILENFLKKWEEERIKNYEKPEELRLSDDE